LHLYYSHCIAFSSPLPTSLGKTCSTLLSFDTVNEKNQWHFCCLRYLYREFPCDSFMFICIITWIGSYHVFFFPLYLSRPLLVVISMRLKNLYSLLYRKNIKNTHFLN
jgi:hypothetical protein